MSFSVGTSANVDMSLGKTTALSFLAQNRGGIIIFSMYGSQIIVQRIPLYISNKINRESPPATPAIN